MTTPPVISITDELLAEFEQLAGKATQGPLEAYDTHGRRFIDGPGDNTVVVIRRTKQGLDGSLFIATANPATILALLQHVRELKADSARLDWLAEQLADVNINSADACEHATSEEESWPVLWRRAIDAARSSTNS